MTYSDNFNIRTTSVKFNDVADAIDGVVTRQYAGLTSGTSSAYIATPIPAWESYDTSSLVIIIPHITNSAGATIQISPAVNGVAAKELKIGGIAIGAGILQQGVPTVIAYTGVYFEVLLQNVTVPVGQITAYAGAAAPAGYLLCDGAPVSRSTYSTLFGVISTTYGAGDGLTTFNVPDLVRRVPMGKGSSDAIADNDGVAQASRTLTHRHTVYKHYHGMGAGATASVDITHTHNATSVTGTIGGPSDGLHTHTIQARSSSTASTAASLMRGSATGVDADVNTLNTGSGHSHTFSLTAAGQSSITTSATRSLSGTVGIVTGGVDGNTDQNSSPTNNNNYLIINYIIKT